MTHTKGFYTAQIQFGLRDLAARLHQLNDAVGAHIDLHPVDLELLDVVARRGPVSPSRLAATTGIHPATLTGVLDRLESGGWIARTPDPDDRRKTRVAARYERADELLRLYQPMNISIARLCTSRTLEELQSIAGFLDDLASAAADAADQVREPD